MTFAARAEDEVLQPESVDVQSSLSGLSALLRGNAKAAPSELAFSDQPERTAWSGRGDSRWTFAVADRTATQLAAVFATLRLPPGSLVAVCLPGGAESAVVLAALDRAGLNAFLIPAGWTRETIAPLMETHGIACVITQTRIGPLRPAEMWREIAARYFGLRFVLAFGPDVPDGVIDIDRMILDAPDIQEAEPEGADRGYVSFDTREGEIRPAFRTWRSACAAADVFLASAGYAAGDRIITLLAQDDHRSLTTGVIAGLRVRAHVEFHGLFSSLALRQSLAGDAPTRLVAPGWMEADLARLDLQPALCGVVLVHQAPVRFKASAPLTHGVVDALAFGEVALLAKARDARGRFALSLDADTADAADGSPSLMRVRRDSNGEIYFGGPASEIFPLDRGMIGEPPPDWRASSFCADLFAGIVIGVS